MAWQDMKVIQDPPEFLSLQDRAHCYWQYEYVGGGVGYQGSPVNQKILNFKMAVAAKSEPRWHYRQQAVAEFANLFVDAIPEESALCAIPSSKAKHDPEYDQRFEDLLTKVHAIRLSQGRELIVTEPIARRTSVASLHQDAGPRDPKLIASQLEWVGFGDQKITSVFLIDDVITTGATFKACQSLFSTHAPKVGLGGLFISRRVMRP